VIVVRPLSYCAETDLEKFAAGMKFPIIPCDLCGSQEGLQRNAMKAMLDEGQALARDCAGLGIHTLLGAWRVQKDSAGGPVGRVRGRNYRQVERRRQRGEV